MENPETSIIRNKSPLLGRVSIPTPRTCGYIEVRFIPSLNFETRRIFSPRSYRSLSLLAQRIPAEPAIVNDLGHIDRVTILGDFQFHLLRREPMARAGTPPQNSIRREALSHHRASRHDTVIAHLHARHEHGTTAYPYVISYHDRLRIGIALLPHRNISAISAMIPCVEAALRSHHHIVADMHLAVKLAAHSDARTISDAAQRPEGRAAFNVDVLPRTRTDAPRKEAAQRSRKRAVNTLRQQLRRGRIRHSPHISSYSSLHDPAFP